MKRCYGKLQFCIFKINKLSQVQFLLSILAANESKLMLNIVSNFCSPPPELPEVAVHFNWTQWRDWADVLRQVVDLYLLLYGMEVFARFSWEHADL